jgi:hypothetical protein
MRKFSFLFYQCGLRPERQYLRRTTLHPMPAHEVMAHVLHMLQKQRKSPQHTEWTECLAFSLVVRIWIPPPPYPQASVSPPPHICFRGITHSLAGEGVGVGDPIPTRGQTLWFSRYICTLCPITIATQVQ